MHNFTFKNLIVSIFFIILYFIAVYEYKNLHGYPYATQSQGEIKEQVIKYLNQGAIVIDVRTPLEYKTGHFKGSKLIPHDEIEFRIKELEQYKDKPILLYCRSGNRAGFAKRILEKYGFKNVVNAINLNSFPSDKIEY